MDASTETICPLTMLAWRLGSLSAKELWARYVSLGGNADLDALSDYLSGVTAWPLRDRTILAVALNEHLWDLGVGSLAPVRRPRAGPAPPFQ